MQKRCQENRPHDTTPRGHYDVIHEGDKNVHVLVVAHTDFGEKCLISLRLCLCRERRSLAESVSYLRLQSATWNIGCASPPNVIL